MRLLFILVFPFVELALLLLLGQQLGRLLVLYLLVTFFGGGWIVRRARGLTPLWAAGLLLMIPGLLSDVLALLVLLPASRKRILDWFLRGPRAQVDRPGFPFASKTYGDEPEPQAEGPAPVRDAEFRILPGSSPPDEGLRG